MKNQETLERRREAVLNIPVGWSKRKRTDSVQSNDYVWDPIQKAFSTIERINIGRTVKDFYCVIFRNDV